MMDDESTIQSDPTDSQDIVLPTATAPTVSPLPAEDREGLFDLKKMEDKLEDYEADAAALVTLHADWLEAYAIWSSRIERLRGKVEYLDQKLLVLLNKEPGDEFEEFELVNLGLYVSSGLAVFSGMYGLFASIRAWSSLAENATRFARFKAGGGVALSAVSLVAGAVIAIVNTKERIEFLKRTLTAYDAWYNETAEQIAQMKRAVETEILPAMRGAAEPLGLEGTDDNVIFRALVAALNAAMTDAAEIDAQYRVATRMICVGGFNDVEISNATGLTATVVATRRTEVEGNRALCDRYT